MRKSNRFFIYVLKIKSMFEILNATNVPSVVKKDTRSPSSGYEWYLQFLTLYFSSTKEEKKEEKKINREVN